MSCFGKEARLEAAASVLHPPSSVFRPPSLVCNAPSFTPPPSSSILRCRILLIYHYQTCCEHGPSYLPIMSRRGRQPSTTGICKSERLSQKPGGPVGRYLLKMTPELRIPRACPEPSQATSHEHTPTPLIMHKEHDHHEINDHDGPIDEVVESSVLSKYTSIYLTTCVINRVSVAVPIIYPTLLNSTGIAPANRVRDQPTDMDPQEFLKWLGDQLSQDRNYAHWAWRFKGDTGASKNELLELATCNDVTRMMNMASSRMNDRRFKVPTEILIVDRKVCHILHALRKLADACRRR
jgi:hypothetical protein